MPVEVVDLLEEEARGSSEHAIQRHDSYHRKRQTYMAREAKKPQEPPKKKKKRCKNEKKRKWHPDSEDTLEDLIKEGEYSTYARQKAETLKQMRIEEAMVKQQHEASVLLADIRVKKAATATLKSIGWDPSDVEDVGFRTCSLDTLESVFTSACRYIAPVFDLGEKLDTPAGSFWGTDPS